MKKLLSLASAFLAVAFFLTGCDPTGGGDKGTVPPPAPAPNLDDPNMPPEAKARIQNAQKIAEAQAQAAKPTK